MKVLTVLGTRPEIIRLSTTIPKLDRLATVHVLLHTGQNTDPRLSDVFFRDLGLRAPDRQAVLPEVGTGPRLAMIFDAVERAVAEERPDRALVLGDTDSALSAVALERLGVPVVHMEAGNRCFDPASPEERNRRIVDAASTWNLAYTDRSARHLLNEGVEPWRVFVVGNPILEVMRTADREIARSVILASVGVEKGRYVLATTHRQENVDDPRRLSLVVRSLSEVATASGMPVVWSVHPRTRDRLSRPGAPAFPPEVRPHEPFGFADFLRLERDAALICSDSGTVQEEACLLGVPCVVMRDSTERLEIVERGAAMVAGIEPENVARAARTMMSAPAWSVPKEYLAMDVSDRLARFVMSMPYRRSR